MDVQSDVRILLAGWVEKRTTLLAAYVFLALNGLDLAADEAGAAAAMFTLASGDMKEGAFADWLRSNTCTM